VSEACRKFTTKFDVKKFAPVNVKFEVKPANIDPVTLVNVGIADDTFKNSEPL
jgi:hypothetical protein